MNLTVNSIVFALWLRFSIFCGFMVRKDETLALVRPMPYICFLHCVN